MKTAEKRLNTNEQMEIVEYVVCPKCHSIYDFKDCIVTEYQGQEKKEVSKVCQHIKFPNHPHVSQRQPCNTVLLDTSMVKTAFSKRKVSFRPRKIYAYYPLHCSLKRLASMPGFLQFCEIWREREHLIPTNIIADIYDGAIWKKFRSTFSGPKEPSLSMDSYLLPFIGELQQYYMEGVKVLSPQKVEITIRIMLSCISCDFLASRKLCGFLGHNAKLGCNKCYKMFVDQDNNINFSGYDRHTWVKRTAEKHRSDCENVCANCTQQAIHDAESKYGVRPCALLQLSYYDPIEFVAIDLMHNL